MSTHTNSEFEINRLTGTLFVDNQLGAAFTDLDSIIHASRKEECQLLLVFKGGESNRIQFASKDECDHCFNNIKKAIRAQKEISFIAYKLPRLIIAITFLFMAFSVSHSIFNISQSVASQSAMSSTSSNYFNDTPHKERASRRIQDDVPAGYQQYVQPPALIDPQPEAYPTAQTAQPVQQPAQPQTTHISEAQLSSILGQANKTGRFTIPLNPAKNGPVLYVFADPNCPHCREIEPTLTSLSSEYDIEIFPVAVIGNKESKASAVADGATTICSDDRASMWRAKVGKTEIPPGIINACPEGIVTMKTNNEIYQVAGFIGTPSLVNAKGQQYPSNLPFTREAIKSWLDSGVAD